MNFGIVSKILIFFSLLPHLFSASVPYAGKVSIDGVNYHGEAIFAFEIMDKEGKVHWRNGEAVQDGISIFVRNGRYSVELGGQGTKPLTEDLFLLEPELYLKVRIDLKDGKGYRHLAPDQRIGSTTHALSAEVARRLLPGAVSEEMLNDNLRKYINASFMPEITTPLSDLTIVEGSPISLSPKVSGKFLTYQWYKDGLALPLHTGPELSVSFASPSFDTGAYRIVVSNEFGSVETKATVNVNWNSSAFSMGPTAFPSSTIFIEKGALWGLGSNNAGQLGSVSTDLTISQPIKIRDIGIKQVSMGHLNQIHIDSNGSLWSMGLNSVGQLGTGDNNNSNVPVKVVDSGVTNIDSGPAFNLFIKEDGSLWGMGLNATGQLGTGDNNNSNVPVKVVDSGVVAVAAGGLNSMFRKTDGSLWGMGLNTSSQLGAYNASTITSPTKIWPR